MRNTTKERGKVAAKAFDLGSYKRLLSREHPLVPRTGQDLEKLLADLHRLQNKESASPEEREFTDLLLVLIEKFEEEHYRTKKAAPDAILRELMRARDLKPKDLYEVFGSKGTTSEVLRGKRAISKSSAKALATRFHVSADLFL